MWEIYFMGEVEIMCLLYKNFFIMTDGPKYLM
jgi:hypothetical protein